MSQSVNSYSQIRIILFLIAAYVIWVAVDTAKNPAGGADTSSRIDPVVAKISSEINKNLPFTVNADTRLESTRPGRGKSINFLYTLVRIKKSENRNLSPIFARMRQESINRYQTAKSLKPIRDLGLMIRHTYSDQAGNFLAEYEVGPSDLR